MCAQQALENAAYRVADRQSPCSLSRPMRYLAIDSRGHRPRPASLSVTPARRRLRERVGNASMKLTRLRLIGFKSFVEPTDFLIEPGLTGVVGPNGCGKSNLVEALRWVMGEASHKAMRAAGMDDVIFSGNTGRPARNTAEVAMTIDNTERTAPAAVQRRGHARSVAPHRARGGLDLSAQRPRGAGARHPDPVRRRLDRRALAGAGPPGPHRRDHPGQARAAPPGAGRGGRHLRPACAPPRGRAAAARRRAEPRPAGGRHRPACRPDRRLEAAGPPGGALSRAVAEHPQGGGGAVPSAPRRRPSARSRTPRSPTRPAMREVARTHRRPGGSRHPPGRRRRRPAGAARGRGRGRRGAGAARSMPATRSNARRRAPRSASPNWRAGSSSSATTSSASAGNRPMPKRRWRACRRAGDARARGRGRARNAASSVEERVGAADATLAASETTFGELTAALADLTAKRSQLEAAIRDNDARRARLETRARPGHRPSSTQLMADAARAVDLEAPRRGGRRRRRPP